MRRKAEPKLTPAEIRAKKHWDSLRGAEASDAFLKAEGAATGLALAGAAPLVFQGMCRKEGIKVYFTDRPKTDGRSIWLGPVDLTNPLAAVYCYGHGVHEMNHIKYTEFAAVRNLESLPLKELTNIFEDIRVDLLGAREYQGYLLWRCALFKAYAASGKATWRQAKSMTSAGLLAKSILFYLEVKDLGLTNLKDDADHLLAEANRAFGEDCMTAVLAVADRARRMKKTADAVQLARNVLAVIGDFGQKAMTSLYGFEGDLLLKEPEDPEPFEESSLFTLDGLVREAAIPKKLRPGYADAKRRAKNFQALAQVADWEDVSVNVRDLINIMTPDPDSDHDQALGQQSAAFSARSDYHIRKPEEPIKAKELFYADWQTSASLRHLFQAALEHPLPQPEMLAAEGLEVDDDALALMFAGENRLFRKAVRLNGRETAVGILLDTSGSMTDSQLSLAKVAALRLLEALRVTKGYAASMGLFPGATNRSVTPVADWESTIPDTARRVDFVSGYGCTPIREALLWAATELGARPEERKVIFVMTDGYFPEHEVGGILADMKAAGMLVAMIGIGPGSTPRGDITGKVRFANDLPIVMSRVVSQLSRRLRLL